MSNQSTQPTTHNSLTFLHFKAEQTPFKMDAFSLHLGLFFKLVGEEINKEVTDL